MRKELGKQAWLFIQALPVGTAPDDDGELSGEKNQEYMVVADRVDVSEMTRMTWRRVSVGFTEIFLRWKPRMGRTFPGLCGWWQSAGLKMFMTGQGMTMQTGQ